MIRNVGLTFSVGDIILSNFPYDFKREIGGDYVEKLILAHHFSTLLQTTRDVAKYLFNVAIILGDYCFSPHFP
jgi:hypothetical protein